MGKYTWSGIRTLEHCSLITKMGGAPNQYDGKCEGFQNGDDDEPCETCKKCKLNTTYEK